MLFSWGLLDEKPAWMDERPVVRSDGVVWSRYWWPRPIEDRELLPAARLPRDVLGRILPPDGPNLEVGDLADALYERANHYADEECVEHARQGAISERNAAEGAYINAVRLARQREMLLAVGRRPPHSNMPGMAPYQPPGVPPIPGMPSHQTSVPETPQSHQPHQPHQPHPHGSPGFDDLDFDDMAPNLWRCDRGKSRQKNRCRCCSGGSRF